MIFVGNIGMKFVGMVFACTIHTY